MYELRNNPIKKPTKNMTVLKISMFMKFEIILLKKTINCNGLVGTAVWSPVIKTIN